jgi:hypothetical protein
MYKILKGTWKEKEHLEDLVVNKTIIINRLKMNRMRGCGLESIGFRQALMTVVNSTISIWVP